MDATFVSYPPPYNPAYERENDQLAYDEWRLERDEARALDLAHCCWCRADDLYDCGQVDAAEVMLDLMDGYNKRASEARQRLRWMEEGDW